MDVVSEISHEVHAATITKVATHGRQVAIELFEKHLTTTPQLIDRLWTLSGCRLLCHCRRDQACHGDMIIRHLKLRYPTAHDSHDAMSKAPRTDVLNYMAKLRETPESDDGSTADEDSMPRGSGWTRFPVACRFRLVCERVLRRPNPGVAREMAGRVKTSNPNSQNGRKWRI